MTPPIDAPAPEAYAFPLLVKQLWPMPLMNYPDQEIVYRDSLRMSYRQCRERVGRLAFALASLGVHHGDTVAVMDWDSHRYLEAFYAVPMMGAVLQTVNIRLAPDQLLYTLNHARPKVLLLNEDFLPVYEEIRSRLESVRAVVWLADSGKAAPAGLAAGEYEALIGAAPPGFAFPDFDENTRATTFYTTGTTGHPKGVYFSHRQLVLHTLGAMASCAAQPSHQRFHSGDVYMPITPLFHVHAWGLPLVALQLGVKQVYPGRYVPERLIELFENEKVTFSHCVPTLLHMLLTSPRARNTDFGGWKLIVGGSALPAGLAKLALSRGIDVFGGYGMSETGPMISTARLLPKLGALDEAGELHFRTQSGAPVPLVELRIVDENMNDVPHDGRSTGEVVLRAPWLTQGYLGNPEASAELWRGGYLHTQDIGHIENGYLKVTDRTKDVIKSGGEWVSSIQIEDLLSQHPAVGEAAVFAVRDARWGERPLALVVSRPGANASEDALRAHLAGFVTHGTISRYALPRRVLLVDAIEKTSVGKLDKKLLRQKYASHGDPADVA